MAEKCIDKWTTVTFAMKGHHAVLVGKFTDGSMTWNEPILTGPRCRNFATAEQWAKDWAKAEEIEYR